MDDTWQVTSLEEAQLVLAHVVGHPRLRDALDLGPTQGAQVDAQAALTQHGIALPSNAEVTFREPATESDSPHWDICVTVTDSEGHTEVWCVTVQPPIVFSHFES